MEQWIKKLTQGKATCPPRAKLTDIVWAWLGGAIAIAVVAYSSAYVQQIFIMGSFGASCVLLFAFPDSPFSQPRNVIGGHFLASLVGLLFLSLLGNDWWVIALAAASGIAVMQLTQTVHPPAGSNPVIIMLSAPQWSFLFTPTLIGAVALVLVALIFNNLRKGKHYPQYWY